MARRACQFCQQYPLSDFHFCPPMMLADKDICDAASRIQRPLTVAEARRRDAELRLERQLSFLRKTEGRGLD